jgi:CRP/FNR family transcriptional regulator, cyclic AMP receptor protein
MSATVPVSVRKNSIGGDCFQNEMSSALTKEHAAELAAEILPIFSPKGAMLFSEGQTAAGIFWLRSGQAKESMASGTGKTAIVRVVGPGEILGLSALLTGTPYECTVETLEPTCAHYVRRAAFLHLLTISRELSRTVAGQLIRDCEQAYAGIRRLGVSSSVREKFARLLLQWAECPLANVNQGEAAPRIRVTMTHEEVGQCVGSSRETLTKILGEFRKKKWITTAGTIWTITNEDAIRKMAAV